MTTEFTLPELGENIESADVAEMKVAEGDVIEPEQVVMELETEKAVVELPCPHGGKITKIHVAEGDTVNVGATLLTIDGSAAGDEVSEQDSDEIKPAEQTSPALESDESKTATDELEEEAAESAPLATAATKADSGKPKKAKSTSLERTSDSVPPPAGPATRRMARELGVDLHHVSGSRKGGRITPEDVQAYVRTALSAVSSQSGESSPTPALPDFSKWGEVERQPLNKIAKASAQNLSVSWRTIPHVTQHDLADVTELEADRKRFMKTSAKDGPKITMTAVVIKAVVAALEEFPHVNSSFDAASNELILKKYFHIGVAVDTPHGLLVPVVRNANLKSILEIASELTDLAERARSRKLSLDEMQGATFTITNLGGIGGIGFTPIVNFPEVAILGVSRGRKELQLVDGELQERLMLPLSLSYDHRVINGADAARFVVKLCRDLSDSFQLLIEC